MRYRTHGKSVFAANTAGSRPYTAKPLACRRDPRPAGIGLILPYTPPPPLFPMPPSAVPVEKPAFFRPFSRRFPAIFRAVFCIASTAQVLDIVGYRLNGCSLAVGCSVGSAVPTNYELRSKMMMTKRVHARVGVGWLRIGDVRAPPWLRVGLVRRRPSWFCPRLIHIVDTC